MKTTNLLLLFTTLFILAACEPTQQEAEEKLKNIKIPKTEAALMGSTKSQDKEAIANLLVVAGVNPNARQANGMTALMSAVFNGQEDVAKALLEKGADVMAEAKGFNALSLAVEKGDEKMVKLLLQYQADPNVRPENGLSPLEKAKQQNNTALIALLSGDKE